VTENQATALLPPGTSDVLPPDAAFEAAQLERIIKHFSTFGYERINPPLFEFEETLLSGLGKAISQDTFRLMDPLSQRMLALRSDMTPQLARIATSRLANQPRPLRLSYAGQVIRVRGSHARPERQFAQVGVELIGADLPNADAEVISMAVDGLTKLGIKEVSVDLTIPTLVPAYCASLNLNKDTTSLIRDALNKKDVAGIVSLSGRLGPEAAKTLSIMLNAVGPANSIMATLSNLQLDHVPDIERESLSAVIEAIRFVAPNLSLTVDASENRGFEYHSGVSYSFFAKNVRGELGRGGRYQTRAPNGSEEPSTGLTLFMDTVIKALPRPEIEPQAFHPVGQKTNDANKFRDQGWRVINGLSEVKDIEAEARRMKCTHLIRGSKIYKID